MKFIELTKYEDKTPVVIGVDFISAVYAKLYVDDSLVVERATVVRLSDNCSVSVIESYEKVKQLIECSDGGGCRILRTRDA